MPVFYISKIRMIGVSQKRKDKLLFWTKNGEVMQQK